MMVRQQLNNLSYCPTSLTSVKRLLSKAPPWITSYVRGQRGIEKADVTGDGSSEK